MKNEYIKLLPEDFIVEEIDKEGKICTVNYSILEKIIDLIPKRRKEYLWLTLVKRNYTTQRAISRISKKLKISKKRISFAGTKDKRALTAQKISIWNVDLEKVRKIKIKDVVLKNFKYSNERIKLGDLIGNRFTIKIRKKFSKEEVELIKEKAKKEMPNYFGPQRFGEQRKVNHLIGKQLLLSNFEGAVMILLTAKGNEREGAKKAREFAAKNWKDWKKIISKFPPELGIELAVLNYLVKNENDFANALRKIQKNILKMFIHAYQSYVFNEVLKKLGENAPEKLPLVGYETKLEGDHGKIIKKILDEDGIKLEYFKMKRMPELAEKGSFRKTRIKIENFRILEYKKDYLKIQFVLPKGSYATTVLGELLDFNNNSSI